MNPMPIDIPAAAYKLLIDAIAAYATPQAPKDPTWFTNGHWVGSDETLAKTQGGGLAACAIGWKYSNETNGCLVSMCDQTIAWTIANYQRPDGAFGKPGDPNAAITNVWFVRDFALAWAIIGHAFSANKAAAYEKALRAALDWHLARGETKWWTNGNLEVAEAEMWFNGWKATGDPRYKTAYEAQIPWLIKPPQDKFNGKGWRTSKATARMEGFFTEDPPPSYPVTWTVTEKQYDPEYSQVQLTSMTRLFVTSDNPWLLGLGQGLLDKLLHRVNATYQLDCAGGSRHGEPGRKAAFVTPALAVYSRHGRPDLVGRAQAQWPVIDATFRQTFTYASINWYQELATGPGAILLDDLRVRGLPAL